MIYLDYAATTPMSEEAISVYSQVARKYYGNASSIHDCGSSALRVLDTAREQIGKRLGAEPRGIFFTGGGSEANSLALRSLVLANGSKGKHIISTAAEHASVRNTLKVLESKGYEVTYAPLDAMGRVDLQSLGKLIRNDTILASIHHGNPELGTIQNIKAISELLREHGVLLHSDCVQTFGKIPLNAQDLGMDSLTVSAHKVYGPKAVGAVYIKPSASWQSTLPGTTQEKGFRAGTVDVPGVAAFMTAAKAATEQIEEEYSREKKLKEHLLNQLQKLPFELTLEGDLEGGLPNIIGLRIHGMEGQYAMLECNRHGLAISTGSACSAGSEKASASMVALSRTEQQAREFIRLSLGRQTTHEDIQGAVNILKKVLTQHFNMVKL